MMGKKLIIILVIVCVISLSFGVYRWPESINKSYTAKCKICAKPVYIDKTPNDYILCNDYVLCDNGITLENDSIVLHDYGSAEGGSELSYSIELAVCLDCYNKYQEGFTKALSGAATEFITQAITDSNEIRKTHELQNAKNRLEHIEYDLRELKNKQKELESEKSQIDSNLPKDVNSK